MNQSKNHFFGNVAQKAFIRDGEKILLCREQGWKEWNPPGGRLHGGEDPQEGIIREIKEELNLTLTTLDLLFAQISTHSKAGVETVFLYYEAQIEDISVLALEVEQAEMCWVTHDEALALPLFDEYRRALLHYFAPSKT